MPDRTGKYSRGAILAACAIFVLTVLLYGGILGHDLVNWDDDVEIVANPNIRGLSWESARWAFTSFELGAYKPLPWLAMSALYSAQGLDPAGFHLASLLIHAGNAVLLFIAARLLLGLESAPAPKAQAGARSAANAAAMTAGAAVAALLFALHPLQAEAVCAAHALGDLMAAGFFLASLDLYLLACGGPRAACPRRRGLFPSAAEGDGSGDSDRPAGKPDVTLLAASVILFACGGLCRWQGLSLPVLLVALDWFPLRRLGERPRNWFSGPRVRIWLEKLPYAAVALTVAALNLKAKSLLAAGDAAPPHNLQGLISSAFYLVKTAWPSDLLPVYILSGPYSQHSWSPWVCAGLLVLVSVSFILLRRRWPACLVVWVHYLAALSPTLEFFNRTAMSVHDRYAYVAGMGFPILAAAGLLKLAGTQRPGRPSRRTVLAASLAAVLLAGAGWLAKRQSRVWKDSETLWSHVLTVRPESFVAHTRLAAAVQIMDPWAAEELLHQAVLLHPGYAEPHFRLGGILLDREDAAGAVKEFDLALTLDPRMDAARTGLAMAHSNLGVRLAAKGRFDLALEHLTLARTLDPGLSDIQDNLILLTRLMDRRSETDGRDGR